MERNDRHGGSDQPQTEEEGVEDRNTKRVFRLIGTNGIVYPLIYDERTQEWFWEPKNSDI